MSAADFNTSHSQHYRFSRVATDKSRLQPMRVPRSWLQIISLSVIVFAVAALTVALFKV